MPVTPMPCGRAYKGFPRHHKQLGSCSRASGCLKRKGFGGVNRSQVVWVVDDWNDGLRHVFACRWHAMITRTGSLHADCDCCQGACQRSAG